MKTKNKILYCIWAGLFLLCAGLGMITQRNTAGILLLTFLSVLFFLPAILLLYDGLTSGDKRLLLQLRIISLSSLGLTLLLIIGNTLAIFAGETVGKILNIVYIIVSTPMCCCYWQGVSMFLWACVFVSSFPRMWKNGF